MRTVCQAPGVFLAVAASTLKHEWDSSPAVRDIVARYTHTLMTQMSQAVLCNAAHAMDQRLCRWLLAAHDRL